MGSRKDLSFTEKAFILRLRKEGKTFQQIASICFFSLQIIFLLIKMNLAFQNQLLQKLMNGFARLGISILQKQQADHLLLKQEKNNI